VTSAEFKRDVDGELEQLRRAHVITAVEVETDMLVGVKFAVDGKPFDLTVQAAGRDGRQLAFDHILGALRGFRERMMGGWSPAIPVVRHYRTQRIGIPVERHIGEPSWATVLMIVALAVALYVGIALQ